MDHRDDIYKALADGHRRQILAELCREARRAGELARRVGLAPNAVSFHLRLLRSAGLVTASREGRFLWYRVEPTTLAAWQNEVRQKFDTKQGVDLSQRKALISEPERLQERRARKKRARPQRTIRLAKRPNQALKTRSEDIATDTLPTELL